MLLHCVHFFLLHIGGHLLPWPKSVGQLRLERLCKCGNKIQVDPRVDVFPDLKGINSYLLLCDNDFKLGQLYNDADKYSFVFVNLEENEPVAKAEMLSYCGHLLRLKIYMRKYRTI